MGSLFNYTLSEIDASSHNNLLKYMRGIDEFDDNGDLFRYPFEYEFLDKYRNKSMDVFKMSLCFIYIYSLFYEKTANKLLDNINAENLQFSKSILEKNNWNFFVEAESGYNNCYLWQLHTKNDCYKQIKGFRWVSKLLYYACTLNNIKDVYLPMLYSYRHLVELTMKDYGYVRNDIMVDEIEFYNFVRYSFIL